jgi:dipeptide/tripeptide permease
MQGMCLLTLSVSLPSLKPPECNSTVDPTCGQQVSSLHLGIFFLSLYILAIGTGGTKPNISTIGADQFDVFDPNERYQKLSFFNWWMFSIFFGTLFANTVLVYIQDNVGWTLGYALPTLGLMISVAIFIAGTKYYRHKLPAGSPFTKMARVFVATFRKWRVSVPSDPKELHELELIDYKKRKQFMMESTTTLRFGKLNSICGVSS